MSVKGLKVAVVGATGAVGHELLLSLKKRNFPVNDLVLFASSRSEGKKVEWGGKTYSCQVLRKGCFDGVDLAFFDASDAISKEWVPQAAESGAWVVDNSAAFRMEKDIPLVVPEVNGSLVGAKLKSLKQVQPRDRIFTGPNCSAAPLSVALKPIRDLWGIRRVVVSTYQSTSGAGTLAMAELTDQTQAVLNGSPARSSIFPHRIAFNCIPHIGGFKEDGYTGEEHKIVEETQKMLDLPDLKISVTAVRVPTLSCHALTVNVECEKQVNPDHLREVFSKSAGVILQDRPQDKIYPMGMTFEGDPVEGASGNDAVYIGRIRRDPTLGSGLNLWIVADNLRKGAALNAIQVAEVLLKAIH
ncbi:MAG: aspartate-semialdehyde dehydrogenase [Bdellovibrio sp.]|nr:aspartate-semialdehyde dehydrogenase [Bdellovibrio sp.]